MRIVAAAATFALVSAFAGPALAQDSTSARSLAATCSNCHGSAGISLAGQPKADIVRKMQEFRDGKRPSTIMTQLAKGFTAEQVEQIAGWYAAQKP